MREKSRNPTHFSKASHQSPVPKGLRPADLSMNGYQSSRDSAASRAATTKRSGHPPTSIPERTGRHYPRKRLPCFPSQHWSSPIRGRPGEDSTATSPRLATRRFGPCPPGFQSPVGPLEELETPALDSLRSPGHRRQRRWWSRLERAFPRYP